jgi:hypothetical protein
MPRFRRFGAGLLLLLGTEWSCQKRQVNVPVPTAPSAAQPPGQPATQAPAPTPAPSSAPPATTPTPSQDAGTYQVNKPPAAAAKKPARSTPASSSTTTSTPAAPAATSAPEAAAPKLGDVLSADQQKQLNVTTDQSLARAQASLNSIGGRQLNKDQQSEVEQIKNFMTQAQSRREADPAGAKSLAERAEVLARDLAASFR